MTHAIFIEKQAKDNDNRLTHRHTRVHTYTDTQREVEREIRFIIEVQHHKYLCNINKIPSDYIGYFKRPSD